MNSVSTDDLKKSRESLRAFGQHYRYDISYLEELMDTSPGAFKVFESAMGMGRFQTTASHDLLYLAKIAAMGQQDCGPCTELGVKMAREQQVPENIIQGALHGGKGLSEDQYDVYRYARGVAANEELDPELLPRLRERYGREVVAELALAIVSTRIYPTLKRALGHAKSCSLVSSLLE